MWKKFWAFLNKPLGRKAAAVAPVAESEPGTVAAILQDEFTPYYAVAPAAATSTVAKHVPQPGTAVVEVYGPDNRLLILDTVQAPFTSVEGYAYTTVIVPDGAQEWKHYEFTVHADDILPFALPDHMLRQGAEYLKIWWSSHD